jgi:hypothetical protein
MLNPGKIEEKIPAFAKILENRHKERPWKFVLQDTSSLMLEMGKKALINTVDCLTVVNDCLVLLGDSDEMVSKEESQAIVDVLPNATFKILENTKHPIEKVNINLLANEINRFFHKL